MGLRTDHGFSSLLIDFQCYYAVSNQEGEVKEVFDALSVARWIDDAFEQIHPFAIIKQFF